MTPSQQMSQMREWLFNDDVESRELRGDYEALEAVVAGHPERHAAAISALHSEMKDEVE